jgi:hypothetical protein
LTSSRASHRELATETIYEVDELIEEAEAAHAGNCVPPVAGHPKYSVGRGFPDREDPKTPANARVC